MARMLTLSARLNHDTICCISIPFGKYRDFYTELYDRLLELDLCDERWTYGPGIPRVAIPVDLMRKLGGGRAIAEIYERFWGLEVVYFICNGEEVDLQQQWGIESIQRRAYLFNPDIDLSEWRHGECIGDEAVYGLIEEDIEEIPYSVLDMRGGMEVRPVYAVRRCGLFAILMKCARLMLKMTLRKSL